MQIWPTEEEGAACVVISAKIEAEIALLPEKERQEFLTSLGLKESGSMTPQQLVGNWLATRLLRVLYNVRFTDLGPFRAIRYDKLVQLDMKDQDYGWTVEMQLKAAKKNLRCVEVPVRYRKRIGVSKISGTLKGTVLAGYKIITTIFKYL